jgi:hypothetical protein
MVSKKNKISRRKNKTRGGAARNTHGNFVSNFAEFEYGRRKLTEEQKHSELIKNLNRIRRLEHEVYIDDIKTNKEIWNKNLKNIPADEIQNMIDQKVREIEQYTDLYKLSNNKRGILYEPMFAMLDYLNYQLTQLKQLKKKIIRTIGSSF